MYLTCTPIYKEIIDNCSMVFFNKQRGNSCEFDSIAAGTVPWKKFKRDSKKVIRTLIM